MKRFRKVYIEITNVCNLHCRFCPGTRRAPHFMDRASFEKVLDAVAPYTDYVYFHLMGEPLLHPSFGDFAALAAAKGLQVCLTTNGTLLAKHQEELLTLLPSIHKINISLQAEEANDALNTEDYIKACAEFGQRAQGQTIICYRLWNEGGLNAHNGLLQEVLHRAFPGEWTPNTKGYRLGDRTFLEFGSRFEWPDMQAQSVATQEGQFFCYALKDQFGILCDGTVVPCCLDHEGDIALGNIFENDLGAILDSPRARTLQEGFKAGQASEELCRRCGYATRFVH